MGAGGPPLRWLTAIRDRFAITLHGVCLSVGGRDPLDTDHLDRLAALVDRFDPAIVSEHLAWSAEGGVFLNDLLPPPLTDESLRRTAEHVDQIQTRLGRRILVENPSSYLEWSSNDIAEPVFLNELARRTGCGILLDINNIFVSASNVGFSEDAYIADVEAAAVGEIHLAGHAIDTHSNVTMRVDNHGDHVCGEVWSLFERFVRRAGPRPTLIEWDTNTPSLEILAGESAEAVRRMATATPEGALRVAV